MHPRMPLTCRRVLVPAPAPAPALRLCRPSPQWVAEVPQQVRPLAPNTPSLLREKAVVMPAPLSEVAMLVWVLLAAVAVRPALPLRVLAPT